MDSVRSLVGRILVAAIFLIAGLSKIGDFSGTSQFMASKGIPLTDIALVIAILIEILGGVSLILGYKAKWGAWILFAFMIPATLIFHTNFSDQNQMIHFLKNLAIMGGLLYITAYGAGPFSLDGKMKKG